MHAEPICRHLRAQVRQPLVRHLAIKQKQLLNVGVQFAFGVKPDRWNAQPLLIDMGAATIGEVGMVSGVDRPADDPVVVEDRFGKHDVGQMGAAAFVSVIAHEDIARPDVLHRIALQNVRNDADETAEMHRDVLGLAERVALSVEQGGRAIAALLDVRGIAGPNQRLAHLLHNRRQRAADDLDRDRVDLGHGASSRMMLR